MTTSPDMLPEASTSESTGAVGLDVVAINDTVRRMAKALISLYGVTPERVAPSLGLSKSTLYRRLNGESPFTAGESAVLAARFGTTLDALYTGTVQFDPELTNQW